MARRLQQPLSDEKTVAKLIEKTRTKDTIGDLCFFEAEGVEITPEELRAKLRARGIAEWSPVDIRKKTAMRKALTSLRAELEDPNNDMKVLIRKVLENNDKLIYAIVAEAKDLTRVDLDYSTLNQVHFDKINFTLSFTQAEVPEIRKKFAHLCTVYTRREVVYMTRTILAAYGGFILKSTGGMWFVPAQARNVVDALRDLYNTDLNGNFGKAWFRPLGLINNENTKAMLGEAMKEEIERSLEEARLKFDEVMADEKARPSSISYAVNKYKEAKGKAELYAQFLTISLDDINKQVAAASEKAREVLLARDDAKAGLVGTN